MYVCKNATGDWFVASDYLAAALDRSDGLRGPNVAVALTVETGESNGLRWAERDGYRILAYAEGGYCCLRYVDGIGWCLFPLDEDMPEDVERALCCALGVGYGG